MNKRAEDTAVIAFKYPVRKKDLLQKLYGRNIPFLMALLADKLIADQEVIQLKIPMEIEQPPRTTGYKGTDASTIEKVKLLLAKGNVSQTKIAKLLGVSDSVVSSIKHKRYKKYEDKEGGMVLEDNTSQER